MTGAEKIARQLIANRPTENLLNDWELTTTSTDENIDIVRGWLMDELESRNPEAFEEWILGDARDEELRTYMMK